VQRIHSFSTFSKPFSDQCGANLVVAEEAAILAFGGLVQFDAEVLDGGRAQLLGHALLYVAGGLAHLELTRVRRIGNGVGVDARASFGFWGEDFVDGWAYSSPRPPLDESCSL
jgi:hypothetical protein